MNIENKVLYIDNLRFIAIIGVIFVHVDINTLNGYGIIPNINWWIANLFQSLFSFCIPVFVMITGALLLSKDYKIKYFLKNRFIRLIIPFLFWSIIYIIFNFKFLSLRNDMSVEQLIKWFFLQLNGLSSVHFWYVYMIAGVYLTIPIIGRWIRNCNRNEIIYFLIIWLISVFISQPFLSDYKPNIDLTFFSGFMGYLVLGYFLSTNKPENKKLSIILIVTGFLFTLLGTYLYTIKNGKCDIHLYNSLSPNIIIFSSGVFLFFKGINLKSVSREESHNEKTGLKGKSILIKFRNSICKYSFGIYLIHLLILILLERFGISSDFVTPVMGIPITVVLCLIISGIIVFSVSKLPFGKYISG